MSPDLDTIHFTLGPAAFTWDGARRKLTTRDDKTSEGARESFEILLADASGTHIPAKVAVERVAVTLGMPCEIRSIEANREEIPEDAEG